MISRILVMAVLVTVPATALAQQGSLEHIDPEELHSNPAFTQVIVARAPTTTIYISGQNGVDSTGAVVARNDIGAQTEQALVNIRTALTAAGADLEDVVRWNVLVVEGQPAGPGFAAFQRIWGDRPNPPTITVAFVSALANPAFLVEIDAIAVVPQ